MIKTVIFKENIDDNLWPDHIFAIIYIKNNQLIKILKTSALT